MRLAHRCEGREAYWLARTQGKAEPFPYDEDAARFVRVSWLLNFSAKSWLPSKRAACKRIESVPADRVGSGQK